MISDDDLLLYYYRDGLDAAERSRIGAALADQPELARRLHGLVARLDAAAALPEVPVPPQTQQRWQVALDRAAREPRVASSRRMAFSHPRWQALAAAAAVAVIALVFGVQKAMTPTPPPETTAAANDASAYESGLKRHLASTEQRLASLGDATPEERARLVETIISQNRVYALAAERAGEPQLARVLRAFTPVLESVADGRSQTAGGVAQLNFELRVMQARLGAEAATPTRTL